jgi:hypothetical protein
MTIEFPRHKFIRTCGMYGTYAIGTMVVPLAAFISPALGGIVAFVAGVVITVFGILPDVVAYTNGLEVGETLIGWPHTSEPCIAKSGKKAVITVTGHCGPQAITIYGCREQFEALARLRASWCEVVPIVRGQGPYRG